MQYKDPFHPISINPSFKIEVLLNKIHKCGSKILISKQKVDTLQLSAQIHSLQGTYTAKMEKSHHYSRNEQHTHTDYIKSQSIEKGPRVTIWTHFTNIKDDKCIHSFETERKTILHFCVGWRFVAKKK